MTTSKGDRVMSLQGLDIFNTRSSFSLNGKNYIYYNLNKLEEQGFSNVSKIPFSVKVILEAAIRQYDGKGIVKEHIARLANWTENPEDKKEVPFKPARILLHDTTGVPLITDLAAIREAVHREGGDVSKVNPQIPVDLIVDHSVTVNYFGRKDAMQLNEKVEFDQNEERFRFLRWAQSTFDNFRVFPPSTGIMHQINLEYLATVATTKEINGETIIHPDSLVGADSHTTMINGLGIVGYGVGGIEAESAMLGQPLYFVNPEVIGVKLTGKLPEGTTATDLALTITNMLRQKNVTGKFIEFFGEGMHNLSLFDRAPIANMAPEYGATMSFFPVDDESLNYLRFIGKSEEQISLIKTYYEAQGMFYTPEKEAAHYTEVVELDLSTIVSCLAGPKRPQDRIELTKMKETYEQGIRAPIDEGGFGLTKEKINQEVDIETQDGEKAVLKTGSVVLAAITSCTNTSNPNLLIGAGLIARKALKKGLQKPFYVKSSLTPGSRVVTDYLRASGLLKSLEGLGFHVAGYGCATCIGNSGALPVEISKAIVDNDMTVAAVLSGNRNFEGRVHPQIKANYLASPPLVVAYALAGTVDIDLINEPLGYDQQNQPVYLRDLWPTTQEVDEISRAFVQPEMFKERYDNVLQLNKRWNEVEVPKGELYDWDETSTYIKEPPFLKDVSSNGDITDIRHAKVLALFGDSVTTDHASPSGAIKEDSPAGKYLLEKGIPKEYFNSYPSRRGNFEVMIRGAFGNVRVRNKIVPGIEGGFTKFFPSEEVMSIYDASKKYKENKTDLIVIAGKEYGTGSSRDWAAKGPYLLGVKAIIAESFERIHRSNLVGMGILPLQFAHGMNAEKLQLTGSETIDSIGINNDVRPGQLIKVNATDQEMKSVTFEVIVRLDSVVEIDYYRHGGIMQTVLQQLITN